MELVGIRFVSINGASQIIESEHDSPQAAIDSVVAAYERGDKVYVGVSPKGEIIGVVLEHVLGFGSDYVAGA